MTSAKLANIALKHIGEVLDKLTDDQLTELAEGRAYFEFRSAEVVVKSKPIRKTAAPLSFDLDATVREIQAFGTAAEVSRYLEKNKFKLADLKVIAKALGPTVSQTGTKVADLKRNIAEGTAGFRERAAARGTWQR